MYIIQALLCCCPSSLYVILTQMTCGKNLTRPEPGDESECGESRAVLYARLPWYTSGFK